mgnify:CR=1 FL=1
MKNNLTKAAVAYGTLRAWISSFIVSVFGLIGIIYCIYLFLDSIQYKNVVARVVEPNCEEYTEKIINRSKDKSETERISTSFKCDLELEYNVNSKLIKTHLFKEKLHKKYNKNEEIKIGYKPNNPKTISDSFIAQKWGSFFGVLIILLVVSITYFNLYMVLKNKSIAGVEGTIGFASNMRRALSSKNN